MFLVFDVPWYLAASCIAPFHVFLFLSSECICWRTQPHVAYRPYKLCAVYILVLQLMEAGTSGANGRCAAASVRGSGAGSAILQHPDTEARCVKGTARPLRTAQMDCVPRVRPFSLLGLIIIIIIYTLTVIWQNIASLFEQEVCVGKEITLWTDTDSQCMVMAAPFILYTTQTTYCRSCWVCQQFFWMMLDVWN